MRLQIIASVFAAGCVSRSAPPATPPATLPATPQPIAKTPSAICAGPLVTLQPFVDPSGYYGLHASAHPEVGADYVGRVRFIADLNGDGVEDLGLSFGSCGSLHECLMGVYVYCAPGKYAVVVPPTTLYLLEVGAAVSGGWVDLVRTDRIDKHTLAKPISLVFEGTRYRERASSP
jgi:hypothetical protein